MEPLVFAAPLKQRVVLSAGGLHGGERRWRREHPAADRRHPAEVQHGESGHHDQFHAHRARGVLL